MRSTFNLEGQSVHEESSIRGYSRRRRQSRDYAGAQVLEVRSAIAQGPGVLVESGSESSRPVPGGRLQTQRSKMFPLRGCRSISYIFVAENMYLRPYGQFRFSNVVICLSWKAVPFKLYVTHIPLDGSSISLLVPFQSLFDLVMGGTKGWCFNGKLEHAEVRGRAARSLGSSFGKKS